jgi:two-component system nitrogen regulation sensor histidine kinase NtrY
MSFRSRLLITSLIVVLLPMTALAIFIHNEMTRRLSAQYERRVEALVGVIEQDLQEEGNTIAASLDMIRRHVVEDNRFRQAAVDHVPEQRRYLLDYAGDAMQIAGLSMLQIQDEKGRIVSSGHFRNEFDRLDAALPALLASVPKGALVRTRAADTAFIALARLEAFEIGGRRFTIIGGLRVDERFLERLARGDDMAVSLLYPGGSLISLNEPSDSEAGITRKLDVPYIDSDRGEMASAQFRVTHRLDELRALRSSINHWFIAAVAVAALLSIILVSWVASRMSRPLVALADKTSRIDLDRLDVEFDVRRNDEIGALSRVLGAMTERLRASARTIKDAERRATLGELARQVNHDIKNGLTPIRNVLRHVDELARTNDEDLAKVFRERQGTLDSGIAYLENLATNYARLSPRGEPQLCRVDDLIRSVAGDVGTSGGADIRLQLSGGAVFGDPVSLRRVFENLITNAVESFDSKQGSVTISTQPLVDERGSWIRIVVADTGVGLRDEEKAKIFDDFYTTKDTGTGLGLTIVRRLVMDLDGVIQVESEPGKGSRFIVDLPAANEGKA